MIKLLLIVGPEKDHIFNPVKKYQNAFHFILNNPDYVQFTVFDLKGKSVINLIDGKREKGRYVIPWSGNSTNGNIAGKGTYIADIRIGMQSQRMKFTVCE